MNPTRKRFGVGTLLLVGGLWSFLHGGSGGGAGPLSVSLASYIPATVSRAWAGAGAREAALSLHTTTLGGGSAANRGSALVVAGMQLAAHLLPDSVGFFDQWGAGAPADVRSQQGIVWCTDFVASVYQVASGKPFPAYGDAVTWWNGAVAHAPGVVQVPPRPGLAPAAGDIVVLDTAWKGHVALIVGVQPGSGGTPGSLLVVQAHSDHVLERWALQPDGTVMPPWSTEWTQTLGYLRLPALTASVAARIQPIIQANPDAGYDSPAQHDAYWDSACAAAVMTEVLLAWGVSGLTLGRILDEFGADLSPTAGLLTQNAWDRVARLHGFGAEVEGMRWSARRLSYSDLLQEIAAGLPVVIGMRGTPAAYPALAAGHFLVVVGGDAAHLSIVDSSLYRLTSLSRVQVDTLWTGETVLIQPT